MAKAKQNAFFSPVTPSKELAAITGSEALPRTEVVKKMSFAKILNDRELLTAFGNQGHAPSQARLEFLIDCNQTQLGSRVRCHSTRYTTSIGPSKRTTGLFVHSGFGGRANNSESP